MAKLWITLVSVLALTPYSVRSAELGLLDRQILARALAAQDDTISVVIATKPENTATLERGIRAMRGEIGFSANELGYIRARVPSGDINSLLALPQIEAINIERFDAYLLSETPELSNRSGLRGDAIGHLHRLEITSSASPKSLGKVTLEQYLGKVKEDPRYYSINAMGIPELRSAYPTFDGRGVTIAVVEGFVDPTVPELSSAKDLNGRPIRKVPEMYSLQLENPSRVFTSDGIPSHVVRLSSPTRAADNSIIVGDRPTQVFPNHTYLVGTIPVSYLPGVAPPTNLYDALRDDGNGPAITIAWDTKKLCAIIDTNRNDDLTDEKCVQDYNATGETGTFSPSASGKAGSRFSVLKSPNADAVAIAVAGSHTQSVALAAAGDRFFNSELGGVAPSARLIPYALNFQTGGAIEAAIRAARHSDVDIILLMAAPHSSDQTRFQVEATILDRLVKYYKKLVVNPASNEMRRLNTVSSPSASLNIITVGQFLPSRVALINMGARLKDGPSLATASGPTEDGSLAPDVLAPSHMVLPNLPYLFREEVHQQKSCPNLDLSSAALCFGGTSNATPVAAGAAALLISAAKQYKLSYSPLDIIEALRATARHLSDFGAHEQGAGVIDLPAAWDYLRRKLASERFDLEVTAPVRTALSDDFREPNVGVGLYEREGWNVGMQGKRTISIKRVSGPKEPVDVTLKIIGKYTSTFSAPHAISLPLNQPVDIPIIVSPKSAGVHSAILRVIDSRSGRYLSDISLVIVSPLELSAVNDYKINAKLEFLYNNPPRMYFRVPANTIALRARHRVPGNYWISFNSPFGAPSLTEEEFFKPAKPGGIKPASGFEKEVYYPAAGVWELSIENRRDQARSVPTPIDIEVEAIVASESQPTRDPHFNNLAVDGTQSVEGQLERTLSKKDSLNTSVLPGLYMHGRKMVSSSSLPVIIHFDVPEDARYIDARVNLKSSDQQPHKKVSLILFECKPKKCYGRKVSVGQNRAGAVATVLSPGRWALAIDVPSLSGSTGEISYDLFIEKAAAETAVVKTSLIGNRLIDKKSAAQRLEEDKLFTCQVAVVTSDRFRSIEYTFENRQYEMRIFSQFLLPLARQPVRCAN